MKIKIFSLIILAIIFLPVQALASAESINGSTDTEWRIVESKYCAIFCRRDVDIKKINKKIKIGSGGFNWWRNLSGDDNGEYLLGKKFDRIFEKVEKILDMYPRKIHLKIKIYKNQARLNEAFHEVLGVENSRRFISFYVHKYTTIYLNEEVIRKGIIAHEMAHAVCDHYFLIPPPEKIKEVLAQYIEVHLEE